MTGTELDNIARAVTSGKISGDGGFTKRCHEFFKTKFGFKASLLTTSCTDALEMGALLMKLEPGDEVICPSFTFSSSANAFVLRGAKIVFADSLPSHPNVDVSKLESLITKRTKAIVVVHYAGVAVDMDPVITLAKKHNLFIIEDAAQAIDSYYKGKPLGGFGEFSAFSFHETKNIQAGEGGLFVSNDDRFSKRAEIIREKGTNRSAFFRGEVDKYGWVDLGSSFLPSDIIAAFLWSQLENLDVIQNKRKQIWNRYYENLKSLEKEGKVQLPFLPSYATNNAHCFYMVCPTQEVRAGLIAHVRSKGYQLVFHYQSLHKSPFYADKHDGRELVQSDRYTDCLVRLPLYFELSDTQIDEITGSILEYFKN